MSILLITTPTKKTLPEQPTNTRLVAALRGPKTPVHLNPLRRFAVKSPWFTHSEHPMPDDIAEDLAEARHLIESVCGTLKGPNDETLRDARERLERIAAEVARVEGVVAGRGVKACRQADE